MADNERRVFLYDTEIDLCHESTHTKVLSYVGQRQRVLELGCATGQMSRVLQERGCEVVAIEADAEAAKRAAEHCNHVIVGDLEQLDFDVELGDRRFDVIVAADVLEHLKSPEFVLSALRPFLALGGYLVASVPNVTHGSVRLALLSGSFPYADTGLLDRTHLRFYDRTSMSDMLTRGQFSAVHVDTTDLEIDRSEVPFDLGPEARAFVDALRHQSDALTYQFVVVAFPTSPPLGPIPKLIIGLNSRMYELNHRIAVLGAEHAMEAAELRTQTQQLEAEVARLGAAIQDKDALQHHANELRGQVRQLEDEMRAIHTSKLWLLGTAYRHLKAALRGS